MNQRLRERIDYYKEKQKEIVELDEIIKEKAQAYREEFKAEFGLSDGEKLNMLQLVELIGKLHLPPEGECGE